MWCTCSARSLPADVGPAAAAASACSEAAVTTMQPQSLHPPPDLVAVAAAVSASPWTLARRVRQGSDMQPVGRCQACSLP